VRKLYLTGPYKVSEVVGKRQQITVSRIYWLYCAINENGRIVAQFSEIPRLEVFSTYTVYWYISS
jgi:hypothetical protein